MMRVCWVLSVLAVAAATWGCGDGESGSVNVAGIWADVAADGSSIIVTFVQSGARLTGTFESSSGWEGTVSGAVTGDEIGFTYIYSDGYRVYSRARVSGDQMLDGLFWSLDGARYGTWSASRVEMTEVATTIDTGGDRRAAPPPPDPGPAPLAPTVTIRFNTVFFPGGPIVLTDIIESDMRFFTPAGVTHSDIGDPMLPDNGTPFMLLDAGQTPLVITNTTSAVFALMSVDLSEFSTVFAAPRAIPFVGYKADGSTVSRTFNLDGVIDGSGPLGDFETFSFGNDFRDLTRVEVQTDLYCMDNVVLGQ